MNLFLIEYVFRNIYPTNSAHRNSTLSIQSDHATMEAFYENRSRFLLRNPSRIRDEITLFARRAAEQLHERLPRLSNVPHRVKIIDYRETKQNLDQHTLLQIKHKHHLALIAKRRQAVRKMMTQTKQNQKKLKQLNIQTPLTRNNPLCCRELLERMNQYEETNKKQHFNDSQIDFISQKTLTKTIDYSSSSSPQTTTINGNITSSFSSSSTPFQDALSIYHVQQTNNVNSILPSRPFTAPNKKSITWVNPY